MKRLFYTLVAVTFSLSVKASAGEQTCQSVLSRAVTHGNARIEAAYAVNGAILHHGNRGEILWGANSEHAVILIHGFMASPFEVSYLAASLNAQGFTTYTPLLKGFGSDAKTANRFDRWDWQRTVNDAVALMSVCYKSISLVGFSLGGTLVLDHVLTQPNARIKSIVLLAPLLELSLPASGIVRMILKYGGFEDQIVPWLSIVSFASSVGWPSLPDLTAVLVYYPHYTEALPMRALDSALELARKTNRNSNRLTMPVFLSYSESDQTVSTEYAKDFVTSHASKYHVLSYPASLGIPHQLTLPFLRRYWFNDLASRVNAFLKGN